MGILTKLRMSCVKRLERLEGLEDKEKRAMQLGKNINQRGVKNKHQGTNQ